MKITVTRKNEDFLFEAKNEKGSTILMDNVSLPNSQGVSPMELLVAGVAGCSAIDIISILKKQKQLVSSYKAEVEAEREANNTPPNFFTKIKVTVFLEGEIQAEKALRASELSFGTYCTVSKTLEKSGVGITYSIILNGNKL